LKFFKVGLVLVFIGGIFVFSWLNSPDFANVPLMPSWLNNWSNLHGQLRTGAPFIPLGFLLNSYSKKWIISLRGFLISFFVVVIAELGQNFIPTRYPDPIDILYGIIGALVGMMFQIIYRKIEVKV
jgi:glycopeptide antibiotics resistance protein